MLVTTAFAQGKGKGHGKDKHTKVKNEKSDHAKNNIGVPNKVQTAFTKDYPNAYNVNWAKNRGDWTATYSVNGFRTTATYHANGSRRDTRTYIPVAQAPQPVVIYRERVGPSIQIGKILKIDMPGRPEVYQLQTTTGRLVYVDSKGSVITFNPL